MDILKWLDRIFTTIFDVFFGLLILAAAIGGGFIAWNILGMMEYSLLLQISGTLLGSIVGAGVGWLAIQIMKIFASISPF